MFVNLNTKMLYNYIKDMYMQPMFKTWLLDYI